jgi:hypothetical protein
MLAGVKGLSGGEKRGSYGQDGAPEKRPAEEIMSQQQTLATPWTRCRGTLEACLQQATGIYHQPHEHQGNPVWRVFVPGSAIGITPQELLETIKIRPEAAKQAILEYDTDRDGEIYQVDSMDEQKDARLWVFAKLYLEDKKDPMALIYHIAFEDEEEEGSPVE